MTNAVAERQDISADLMEKVIIGGDLSKLSATERLNYYGAVCRSLGLNPLTRPFEYLTLNGKMILYADKNCAEQLRSLRSVSLEMVGKPQFENELCIYIGRASLPDGRVDTGSAAVFVGKLTGEALANAVMKCETKMKRRLTLSICGLGMMDDTEVDSVPEARRVTVDHETGEIITPPQPARAAQDARQTAQPSNMGECPKHHVQWLVSRNAGGSPYHRVEGGYCNKHVVDKELRESGVNPEPVLDGQATLLPA